MEQLFQLLHEGVTASHVIDFVKKDLVKSGFLELSFEECWNLKEKSSYYVNLYGTNMIAFRTGRMTGGKPVF